MDARARELANAISLAPVITLAHDRYARAVKNARNILLPYRTPSGGTPTQTAVNLALDELDTAIQGGGK